MPSTNPLDPTNYLAVLPSGTPHWHNGGGTVTYSFLSSIPSYYENGSSFTIDSHAFPDGTNPSLSVDQRAMAELAVQRWNEVANVNLVPAGTATGGDGQLGTAITGDGHLIHGLGGGGGFGEQAMPRNDDGSTSVDISAVFENGLNFFGNMSSSIWVNTNGSISFGSGLSTYTPFGISGSSLPMIAPFFADVDTRVPAVSGVPSNPIYVDIDPTKDVVTITWDNVGFYDRNGNALNSFQLQLYDRGNGDFDIAFRYEDINWTTGEASGGDSNGLGGTIARAGFSAGDGSNFYELAASGNQATMLGLEGAEGNSGVDGLWAFQVRNGITQLGQVTFGSLDFNDPGLFGFAYYPGTGSTAGDVWLNEGNSLVASPTFYDEGWDTFIHELGHALGLDHPFEGVILPASLDNSRYTVMSYDPAPEQAGVDDPQQQFPATPMLYDIQALQSLYGANMETRASNDVYFAAGGVAGFEIPDGGSLIATIWDADGDDTFSAAGQTAAVTIDLRPGYFSSIGAIANNIGIALGVAGTQAQSAWIENAIGGSGNDTLVGNGIANRLQGRAGDDHLSGGNRDDYLIGDNGNDTLNGDADNDTLTGGNGGDTLHGGDGNDTVYGGADDDPVVAGDGGDDILSGGVGNDGVSGGAGADTVYGGAGEDVLDGAAGVDLLSGGADNDGLTGGDQGDTLYGGAGNDSLSGDAGNDIVSGGAGNDVLRGGANSDQLLGAAGMDNLDGGTGNDTLTGGSDADIFVFAHGYQADTIQGIENDIDTIRLDDNLWGSGLTVGQVLSTYAHQTSPGIVDFDFGGDALRVVNGAGITVAQLQDDIAIV
jgi:Ca2+-binding RTX toxin-like protein